MGVPPELETTQRIDALLGEERWTEAFELVLEHYQAKVFHLALSILGDRASAEDTAQDAFLRIWRGLPGFRGAASLSTWIYAIARNTSLTALQALGSRTMLSLDLPATRAAAESRQRSTPDHADAEDILQFVSDLPEKYRRILILYYMEEMSYQQVAEILALPMGTVKTNLHRAKKELAEALSRANISKGGAPCSRP